MAAGCISAICNDSLPSTTSLSSFGVCISEDHPQIDPFCQRTFQGRNSTAATLYRGDCYRTSSSQVKKEERSWISQPHCWRKEKRWCIIRIRSGEGFASVNSSYCWASPVMGLGYWIAERTTDSTSVDCENEHYRWAMCGCDSNSWIYTLSACYSAVGWVRRVVARSHPLRWRGWWGLQIGGSNGAVCPSCCSQYWWVVWIGDVCEIIGCVIDSWWGIKWGLSLGNHGIRLFCVFLSRKGCSWL